MLKIILIHNYTQWNADIFCLNYQVHTTSYWELQRYLQYLELRI